MLRSLFASLLLACPLLPQLSPRITRKGIMLLPADSQSIMRVEDVNADGSPELLYRRSSKPDSVFMSFGTKSLRFGSRVAEFRWQDWNGDRVEDLLVGLPQHRTSKGIVGAVRILDGKDLRTAAANPKILFERSGKAVGAGYGSAILAFDSNGDAHQDLLVASKTHSEVVDGRTQQVLWSIARSGLWDRVGDVDFDGIADVFVSPEIRSGRHGKLLRSFLRPSWAVGDLSGDGISEIVSYVRQDFKTQIYWLWSGRGYRVLGEWKQFGPASLSLRPYDARFFQVIDSWAGVLGLADEKFQITTLLKDRFTPIGGAFPWSDLDEDGLAETLALAVDKSTTLMQGDAYSQLPYTFYADRLEVPIRGGTQTLSLAPPPAVAASGKLCVILGTASGRYPSFRFGRWEIPLAFDAYTQLILTATNSFLAPNAFLFPNASSSVSTLRIPNLAGLKGLRLDHTYLIFDKSFADLDYVSTPVPLWIR